MYGAILGDMIGAPYEFNKGNKSKKFPLFCRQSQFTDDSVMTIAVAEALMDSMGEYGEVFSKVAEHFLEAINLAKHNEKNVSGIVINAFSEPFVVSMEMLDIIADMESSITGEEDKSDERDSF